MRNGLVFGATLFAAMTIALHVLNAEEMAPPTFSDATIREALINFTSKEGLFSRHRPITAETKFVDIPMSDETNVGAWQVNRKTGKAMYMFKHALLVGWIHQGKDGKHTILVSSMMHFVIER